MASARGDEAACGHGAGFATVGVLEALRYWQ